MSSLDELQSRIEHPAPHKGRVPAPRLFAGLVGGPAAWVLQMLIGYASSSDACTLTQGAHGQARLAGFHGEVGVLLAVNLACLAIAVAAGLTSWRDWIRTREEKPGDTQALISIGEGRTRFLALCGMISGAIFATAILFNTVGPIMVPVCWSWR